MIPYQLLEPIIFSTAENYQNQVEGHVLLGENPMAYDNTSIRRYVFDGLFNSRKQFQKLKLNFR